MSRLGVVAALPAEAAALAGRRVASGEIVALAGKTLLFVSGIGGERAARAALELRAAGARALLSWGVVGGLDPDLKAGDLLLPAEVVGRDRTRYATDPAWRRSLERVLGEHLRARSLPLVQGETALADSSEKSATFLATGAGAVDLESGSVAAAAREAGLPFVAIKAVCDPAGQSIPPAALAAVDPEGRLRPGALLRSVASAPRQVGDMLRLRSTFRAALRTLVAAARLAGPGLLAPVAP